MKFGLVSSCVPLVNGGARFIINWLAKNLEDAGHQAETILIPQTDEPETLLQQTTAFRLLDLDDRFDRVVTFRPPAHVVRHRAKIVWFIHHIRFFYDLWDTPYNTMPRTAYLDS